MAKKIGDYLKKIDLGKQQSPKHMNKSPVKGGG